MSPLPQRKKSAEEIAKIREGLGIPVQVPEGAAAPQETAVVKKEIPSSPAAGVKTPAPALSPASSTVSLPKPVRSLRKSEQVPITGNPRPSAPRDSKLPAHRHTDEEVAEIRRQVAISMQTQQAYVPPQAAHVALIIPGYLLVLAGAASFYFFELDLWIPASCIALALFTATFIFMRKPLSRHHGAFISVTSLFVIAFGALHYFPQLRYGS